MTKHEREYFRQLITDTNELIKAVYNNTRLSDIYKTEAQRSAFIQGLSVAMEPFAHFVGEEVASVDLNQMPKRRISTPRGSFLYDPMSEAEARALGWGFHHEHGGFLIMAKDNRAIAIDEVP